MRRALAALLAAIALLAMACAGPAAQGPVEVRTAPRKPDDRATDQTPARCTHDLARGAHCAASCPEGRTCVREETCGDRVYCFRVLGEPK